MVAQLALAHGAGIVLVPKPWKARPMHMHPTVTHAAADCRRHAYLAEAATRWHSRPEPQQRTIRRRTRLVWRIATVVDGALTWLTREFAPTPARDLTVPRARPLSLSRTR